jgi:hypothetical protein
MILYCKNTTSGLVPLYPADWEERRKLKIGKEYRVEVKHPRNYQFHKKFFALVNLAHENYETDMPFDTFRRWLIMRAGFVKAFSTDRGTFYDAESISFANMNQVQFEEVYNRVLNIVIKLLQLTEDDITDNLLNFF